jgi:outer membrane receptor for ferrienterochelin and colicins
MYKIILSIVILFMCNNIFAQHTFTAIVKDSTTKQPLAGATISQKGKRNTTVSDSVGEIMLTNISNGKQIFTISFVGYEKLEIDVIFPLSDSNQVATIFLTKEAEEELEEVVVASTRTSRTINNTPTRVETIDLEEIDEKSNMKPSNVSMILHESTGIQVQQTSATSGNASIRIQGLDGRYTQLLKDGYASFGNFASGLSILEIPPLDLKQVEIIKGPASTLYGAGAIAGVVNFISRTPKEKLNVNVILNQSNVGQTNIGAFAMQRNKKIGFSILALINNQNTYDVDKDDFTELPKATDFTLHPKLFLFPTENSTIIIGNSFSNGKRTGGDMNVINGKADNYHTYFERNNTTRNTTTLDYSQKFKNGDKLIVKTSFNYFKRNIAIPIYTVIGIGYNFTGINTNSFNDVSYIKNIKKQTLIFGTNFISDKFKEQSAGNTMLRNFTTTTIGIYAQQTWDATEKLKLESGFRIDRVNFLNQLYSKTENFFLPRISVLYKFNNKWSSRIGAGLGYKTPTIFTELTETIQYQNVLPLNNVTSEKSIGGTADVNYKTKLGEHLNFSANQMFFYTSINNASELQQNNTSEYFFANGNKAIQSVGFETNLKFIYKGNFKFFVGYTFTDARATYISGKPFLLLLPKSKLNLALVYEKEDKIKIGLEGYATGQQYLSNGTKTPSFFELGFMVEKIFNKFSIFINAENFTDVRQSRYKRVVNEPHNNPTFDDIWTHTEGRTFNAGLKFKL